VTSPAAASIASESPQPAAGRWRRRGGRVSRPATALIARGEPVVWLTAGALAIALFMILGLVGLIVVAGGRAFWPARLDQVELLDGRVLLGQSVETESYELTRAHAESLPDAARPAAARLLGDREAVESRRTQLRVDNKQLSGESYVWIDELLRKPGGTSRPPWALAIERTSWGRFVGFPGAFTITEPRAATGTEQQLGQLIQFLEQNSSTVSETAQPSIADGIEALRAEQAQVREKSISEFLKRLSAQPGGVDRVALLETGEEVPLRQATASQPIVGVRTTFEEPERVWHRFQQFHPEVLERVEEIHSLDRSGLGQLSQIQEQARMDVVRAGLDADQPLAPLAQQLAQHDAVIADLDAASETRAQLLAALGRRFDDGSGVMQAARAITAGLDAQGAEQRRGTRSEIDTLSEGLTGDDLAAINSYRQVVADGRRRTAEISSDLDVLRAANEQYVLRAVTADRQSQDIPLAEIVRAFPANRLDFWGRLKVYFSRWTEFLLAEPREANTEGGVFPAIWGTVAMTLIMTVAVVPFGVLAALFLREYAKAGVVVSAVRIAVNNLAGVPSIVWGVFGLGFFCYVVGAGIDETFYPAYVSEHQPVFGTGGLMWASLTLSLLTLPVVIVATEEALASVPNSMREGSYACGASKWQTIRRIVLPRALPGIMTGMILAMARGAGEVAPLMLVGAVKIAPQLPLDGDAPFIHPSRSFMHLGFHIYDLGFQSPDSEAAQPMVFTTTLLLISLVGILNILAIRLRSRLRKRFGASQF
jgi:phosphate ABC transporter permease subunit PstA